jgi:hypothetical protein
VIKTHVPVHSSSSLLLGSVSKRWVYQQYRQKLFSLRLIPPEEVDTVFKVKKHGNQAGQQSLKILVNKTNLGKKETPPIPQWISLLRSWFIHSFCVRTPPWVPEPQRWNAHAGADENTRRWSHMPFLKWSLIWKRPNGDRKRDLGGEGLTT